MFLTNQILRSVLIGASLLAAQGVCAHVNIPPVSSEAEVSLISAGPVKRESVSKAGVISQAAQNPGSNLHEILTGDEAVATEAMQIAASVPLGATSSVDLCKSGSYASEAECLDKQSVIAWSARPSAPSEPETLGARLSGFPLPIGIGLLTSALVAFFFNSRRIKQKPKRGV